MHTAVILAAGMGVRLKGVIGERPKGLLKIGRRCLLERSLFLLREHGIHKVFVVTGFRREMLIDSLSRFERVPELEFVHSPRYADTGSMQSLYELRNKISEEFLLLESDLFYEKRALTELLAHGQPDTVLTSGYTQSGDEVWIHGEVPREEDGFRAKGRILRINKIPDPGLTIQGELVGISRVSEILFNTMCAAHLEKFSFPSNNHYEEAISDLCVERNVEYLRIDDLVWTEIDNDAHYQRAINKIHPKINQREMTLP